MPTKGECLEEVYGAYHNLGSFLSSIVIYTLAFFAVLGNLALVATILRYRELRKNTTNILLLSMAFSDLATVLLVMPLAAYSLMMGRWAGGCYLCKVHTYVSNVATRNTQLTLAAVSIKRCVRIANIDWYNSMYLKIPIAVHVAAMWLVAAVTSLSLQLGVVQFRLGSGGVLCEVSGEPSDPAVWSYAAVFVVSTVLLLASNGAIFCRFRYGRNMAVMREKEKLRTLGVDPNQLTLNYWNNTHGRGLPRDAEPLEAIRNYRGHALSSISEHSESLSQNDALPDSTAASVRDPVQRPSIPTATVQTLEVDRCLSNQMPLRPLTYKSRCRVEDLRSLADSLPHHTVDALLSSEVRGPGKGRGGTQKTSEAYVAADINSMGVVDLCKTGLWIGSPHISRRQRSTISAAGEDLTRHRLIFGRSSHTLYCTSMERSRVNKKAGVDRVEDAGKVTDVNQNADEERSSSQRLDPSLSGPSIGESVKSTSLSGTSMLGLSSSRSSVRKSHKGPPVSTSTSLQLLDSPIQHTDACFPQLEVTVSVLDEEGVQAISSPLVHVPVSNITVDKLHAAFEKAGLESPSSAPSEATSPRSSAPSDATSSRSSAPSDATSPRSDMSQSADLINRLYRNASVPYLIGLHPLRGNYSYRDLNTGGAAVSYPKKLNVTTTPKHEDVHLVTSLVTVVSAFLLCYVPYYFVLTYERFGTVPNTVTLLSICLSYASCIVNPFVYGLGDLNIRNGFRMLLDDMHCATLRSDRWVGWVRP